jgi:hypothetical protein
MELLQLLRLFWRRRIALGVGVVLAVAAAVGLGSPPATSMALAWTNVALDTPASQLVKSAPSGADTLPWRASLLSHLMGTDATQRELARRLRVRVDEVGVIDGGFAVPDVPNMTATKAADASLPTAAPYQLTVSPLSPGLPVIMLKAAAPDRTKALRLAAAAVAVLESRRSSGGTYTSIVPTGGGASPKLQPFVVQQVTPIRVKRMTAMTLPIKQIAAALFILGAWSTAVLLGPRLIRRRPRPAIA